MVVPEILALPESNDALCPLRLARYRPATQFGFCVSGNFGHCQFARHRFGLGIGRFVCQHDAAVGDSFGVAFNVANCGWRLECLFSDLHFKGMASPRSCLAFVVRF